MTGESACEPQMRQLVLRMTCIKPVTSTLSRAEIITRARKDARFPAGPAVPACGGSAPSGPDSFAARSRRPGALEDSRACRTYGSHPSPEALAARTKQKARRVTTGLARLAGGLGFEPR